MPVNPWCRMTCFDTDLMCFGEVFITHCCEGSGEPIAHVRMYPGYGREDALREFRAYGPVDLVDMWHGPREGASRLDVRIHTMAYVDWPPDVVAALLERPRRACEVVSPGACLRIQEVERTAADDAAARILRPIVDALPIDRETGAVADTWVREHHAPSVCTRITRRCS